MAKKKDPNAEYLKPVPPQEGYRRGFEPRPGETDEERLAREVAELKRRAENRRRLGSDYSHYRNAKGGKVKKYASGGSVSSASKRADGIAQRGKTKGRIV